MEVIRRNETPERTVTFPSGTDWRRYYLPTSGPLEVIEAKLNPGVVQVPHLHKVVREATLVMEGQLTVVEIRDGARQKFELQAGDFVVYSHGVCHALENHSKAPVVTLNFKFLGETRNPELFKKDKYDCQ